VNAGLTVVLEYWRTKCQFDLRTGGTGVRHALHNLPRFREDFPIHYGRGSIQPTIRYAKSGHVHVAYQVFGDGKVDLVFVPGFISHLEHWWSEPHHARWLRRLGESARVILFDKRGTGLSDRVDRQPGMDARMDDVRAVMDAVGVERAAIMGVSEAGSLASLFAATRPERCQALILYGAFARFSSWFPTEAALQKFYRYADTTWGTGASLPMFAPSMVGNKAFQEWWGKFERLGANPAACIEIMRRNSQIDVSAVLPTIHVPTLVIHRKDDVAVNVEGGRELAALIPNARYLELSGSDHIPFVGDSPGEIADAVNEFLTGSRAPVMIDRVLSTVLFTDIVGSTEKAAALGDRRWRDLLDEHDKIIRTELTRFRAREIKSLGDGFLATFDGPARAIQCAQSIITAAPSRNTGSRRHSHWRSRICGRRHKGHRCAHHLAGRKSRKYRRHRRLAHDQGSCGLLRHHVRRFWHACS
jgi:pimeloyl-ACP methyl ester carboxylesterase